MCPRQCPGAWIFRVAVTIQRQERPPEVELPTAPLQGEGTTHSINTRHPSSRVVSRCARDNARELGYWAWHPASQDRSVHSPLTSSGYDSLGPHLISKLARILSGAQNNARELGYQVWHRSSRDRTDHSILTRWGHDSVGPNMTSKLASSFERFPEQYLVAWIFGVTPSLHGQEGPHGLLDPPSVGKGYFCLINSFRAELL